MKIFSYGDDCGPFNYIRADVLLSTCGINLSGAALSAKLKFVCIPLRPAEIMH